MDIQPINNKEQDIKNQVYVYGIVMEIKSTNKHGTQITIQSNWVEKKISKTHTLFLEEIEKIEKAVDNKIKKEFCFLLKKIEDLHEDFNNKYNSVEHLFNTTIEEHTPQIHNLLNKYKEYNIRLTDVSNKQNDLDKKYDTLFNDFNKYKNIIDVSINKKNNSSKQNLSQL